MDLAKGPGPSAEGGTWELWNACNGGSASACSTLEAVNQADLNDALGHVRQDSPGIFDSIGGDPEIGFDGSEAFVKARSGTTGTFTGRVTLSRAYSSKLEFVDTVAHELQHVGEGIGGRIYTRAQDLVSPTGLGPRHQAIFGRASEIAGRYRP